MSDNEEKNGYLEFLGLIKTKKIKDSSQLQDVRSCTKQRFKDHNLIVRRSKVGPSRDSEPEAEESLQKDWNILYRCITCKIVTNSYDVAVKHSQMHYINKQTDDFRPCEICNFIFENAHYQKHRHMEKNYHVCISKQNVKLNLCYDCCLEFENACYQKHKKIHEKYIVYQNNFSICVYIYSLLNTDGWCQHFFSLDNEIQSFMLSNSIHANIRNVRMHVKKNGDVNNTWYVCRKCDLLVETKDIESHVFDGMCTIATENANSCRFCKYKFATQALYDRHIKDSYHTDMESARFLQFNLPDDKEFNEAIRERFSKGLKSSEELLDYSILYKCYFCLVHLPSLPSLYRHLYHHDDESEPLLCSYPCCICGLLFLNKHYITHQKSHATCKFIVRENVIGRCNHCNLHFQNLSTFISHLNIHKRNPKQTVVHSVGVECTICKLNILESHLEEHTKWFHDRLKLKVEDMCIIDSSNSISPIVNKRKRISTQNINKRKRSTGLPRKQSVDSKTQNQKRDPKRRVSFYQENDDKQRRERTLLTVLPRLQRRLNQTQSQLARDVNQNYSNQPREEPSDTTSPANQQPITSNTASPANQQPITSDTASPANQQPITSDTASPANQQPITSDTAFRGILELKGNIGIQSKKIYRCQICDVYFVTSNEYYNEHINNHTAMNEKEYSQCKYCELNFSYKSFTDHVSICHVDNDYSINDLIIEECCQNPARIIVYFAADRCHNKTL